MFAVSLWPLTGSLCVAPTEHGDTDKRCSLELGMDTTHANVEYVNELDSLTALTNRQKRKISTTLDFIVGFGNSRFHY